MTARKRNWIVAAGLVAVAIAVGVVLAARILSARIEPYARQAVVNYLSQRFDSDVELRALHIRVSESSPLRLALTRGRGAWARIDGEGLALRMKNRPETVPLFVVQNFRCEVSVESLLHPPVQVSQVFVEGMEIQIPPREERPPVSASDGSQGGGSSPGVRIAKVIIQRAGLTLQPRDPKRFPLRFDIQRLVLESIGAGAPMKYDAALTNAKPPGQIHSTGTFGPWQAAEPGDTPLAGDYQFDKADLGVFAGIAGILNSTGSFEGKLSALTARGEATVPDFRLRMTGQPVPLAVRFTALVDGTNGNTTLQPVAATLGSTHFTTSGGILKHESNQPRAISLNVAMPNGNLRDVLRLAMKGDPFMEGRLELNTKIDIPPLSGKVREKLVLDGSFRVLEGRFLHSTIQQQIEGLSRRARGKAGEEPTADSDPAVSHMMGIFHLENSAIQFEKLAFGFPGASIDLAGVYNLDNDAVDFGGTLKMQATVSQMMTGWKRVVLKPVDRFFEKGGAGTFLRIRVDGTSKAPRFGVNIAGRQLQMPLAKR